MSARNRELLGLIPASLLVTAGFAGVFIQRSNALSNVSLTYGALFLGLCIAAHVFIRITLPHADPYMFPLVAVLASFGLVMVYRIDTTLARQQAQWFVLGLILFAATIIAVPRLPQARALPLRDRLRSRSGCWCCRGCRASATRPTARISACGSRGCSCSSRRSSRRSGWSSSSPATCATRARCWCTGGRRFLGITFPPLKHFGPVVVIWGLAMVTLVVLSDIGSSLMFYGGVAGDAVRRHQPAVVRGDRAHRRGDRLLVPGHAHPAHPRPRRDLAASAQSAGCTTLRSAATRSPTRCSPRRPAGCSGRASARRR